jgi:4-aminobutyrate aminotransferase-like enzyme/GNAT superfamily N-acetyltransferase
MDEVQAGFGLGGTFLWHQRFGLVDASGAPDHPDCVVFAKRAQVGVCMSRFEDLEPTSAFPASLARGRLHAELCADGAHGARVEALVRPRLAELERRWGHRIESPRATGYAIAFEVRDAAEMNAYLEQRFWRGAIVFGAGSRTIRYRLNSSFDERSIDLLFESMHRSLAWLEAHPGKTPPAWEDFPAPARTKAAPPPYRVRVASADEREALLPAIVELEARAYEPARRDDPAHLAKGFARDGVAVVAELEVDGATRIVGSALATPLEEVADVEGPDRDPMLGAHNTLYSIAVTVDPAHHGQGIGRALKLAQLRHAAAMEGADGQRRYQHVSGRNRVPEAGPMSRLNDSLGAYTVFELAGQYEGHGVARYYRQPLGAFVPAKVEVVSRGVDLASGIAKPLSAPPASLRALWDKGALFGPTVNKITVLNYITPAIVRATEWVAALTPAHPHAYLCSGRDETADKSVRVLRWHRKEAQVVIGLEGGYVGHTTACARSISDPSVHRQGPAHFDWPRVPHPAVAGVEASLEALRTTIAASGASRVLGVYVEPVQERTGRVIPDAFWAGLAKLRSETGVPVVSVDTASAYYRAGAGPFGSSALAGGFVPDVMVWWTGGQLGFVHVTSAWHVATPLTLVSTWDGDELSLVQMHHQLRAARSIDVASGSAALDAALAPLGKAGLEVAGRGLYRVVHAGEQAGALVERLEAAGIRVRAYPGGRLAIAPALDRAREHAEALGAVLAR